MSASASVRRPYVRVVVDGQTVPLVLSAETNEGLDLGTSEAEVEVVRLPSAPHLDFWSEVEIWLGATHGTAALSFAGFIVDFNYTLYPRAVALVCRGYLTKAERVIVPEEDAGNDPDRPGVDLSNRTDSQQVQYVIDACGLAGRYETLGGMAHVLGTSTGFRAKGAKAQFVWKRGQTGLDYIQELDKMALGFRTFESGDRIIREQISARPPTGAAEIVFSEGVDIERASATHSVKDAKNRVVVTGYDHGTGPVKAIATAAHPHPVPGVEYDTLTFSSPLIERATEADAGQGLSCEEKARQLIYEVDSVILTAEFTTPRDTRVRPGAWFGLITPDRLELQQNVWVQHVTRRVDDSGFSQTFKVKAPAAIGAGGMAIFPGVTGISPEAAGGGDWPGINAAATATLEGAGGSFLPGTGIGVPAGGPTP
jgi:hypothetical protein